MDGATLCSWLFVYEFAHVHYNKNINDLDHF